MLNQLLAQAKAAQKVLALSLVAQRNAALQKMAENLRQNQRDILAANAQDMDQAEKEGLSSVLQKRLGLTPQKLQHLAENLDAVAQLDDPLGKGSGRRTLPNGLAIETLRVPLGVIGLIFESRPGVAVEAPALAVKSGNAMILRGGHEAFHSNMILTELWQKSLESAGLPSEAIQMVPSSDRAHVQGLMHLSGLDLLIPRGGSALIQLVVQNATVPVIETGIGNCHLYVHEAADMAMALHILRDGKVGNPAVCNALETLLIDRRIFAPMVQAAWDMLAPDGVTFHGDAATCAEIPRAVPAYEEDWAQEYLGPDLAVRQVDGLEEALAHIDRYGSHHSESIVTDSYAIGQTFLARVDAAAVYWNASTRFTDGFEFGLGAEVGISTQKLHARGPMGLEALTTGKTIAYGSGQTRDL
ncbi:MAG: glutamate-5-semialdehyde dehydrogenase [Firmicutes bacterium]|nr:glutamate-5-semialdehyde dehydrogenase [Bacillota bacterium]